MSNDDKPTKLVPRLRFPEFRGSGTFQTKPLSNLAKPVEDRVGNSDAIPYTVTSGIGLISQEEKLGRTIAGKSLCNYYRLRRGDFAFNKSSTKAHPEGYIARLHDNVDAGVPKSIFTCFRRTGDEIDGDYLEWLFQANLHGDWLRKFMTVGGRAHGALNINDDDLFALPVPLPPDTAEQRKIAECLGSLDDWIAAEKRALAALRLHKTGLLQQLFPRPGATRPRLRFPEFAESEEWAAQRLGDVVAISKGKGVAKGDVVEGGATPCVRYAELYTVYGEVITEVKSCTNVPVESLVLSEADDVIVPASGETKEDIATCSCVIDPGVALGSDLNILRSEIDGRFFSYYLNGAKRTELAKLAQGDTVAHLYPSQISQLEIKVPADTDEQRRIADCLVSLDHLIAAETDQLDALHRHKRGVMQQLLPSPDHRAGES